jgi:allantoicase
MSGYQGRIDLASRLLGGSVVAANDEFFAEKENLIKPDEAVHRPATFTLKGQEYDGWETRRRRDTTDPEACDWAIIRLGAPGVVSTVVVDTAHFLGNFPESAAVDLLGMPGYPHVDELVDAKWTEVVARSALAGGVRNTFEVTEELRATHLRLRIFPDGGVARVRAYGAPLPDPLDLVDLPCDLVAMTNGGRVISCSDSFFSSPDNMLQPGESRFMGDGWETARRRGPGHDWAIVALVDEGLPKVAELSTTHYKGNCPATATIFGCAEATPGERSEWFAVLEEVELRPDTTHRFRLPGDRPVRSVRLRIAPDGGIGRFRLYGRLTERGMAALQQRWHDVGTGM